MSSPTVPTDYQHVLSEFLQKQIKIFGPSLTLAKVKDVKGMTIEKSGTIKKIEGDVQALFQEVVKKFMPLSEFAVKNSLQSIIASRSANNASSVSLEPFDKQEGVLNLITFDPTART